MSSDDFQVLSRALSLFNEDEVGLHLAGHFQNLDAYLREDVSKGATAARRNAGKILEDFWNISTVIGRLEWMRSNAAEIDHLRLMWARYAAIDVQAVQIELRSILDYVAQSIGVLLDKPGQAPESFSALLTWVEKRPPIVSADVRDLLLAQRPWFEAVRTVRDSFVHFGGRTIVYGAPTEGILFQVYGSRFSEQISGEALMWNENVAHYDRYAATVIARVLCLLDDFSQLAKKKVAAADIHPPFGARAYSSGLNVIRDWMENLAALLHARHSGPSVAR